MRSWIDQSDLIEMARSHSAHDIVKALAPEASQQITGQMEFVPVQDGLFCSINAWKSETEGTDRLVVRNSVGVQFVKAGKVRQTLSGHGRYLHSGARVSLTTFPREVKQERSYEAGLEVKYVGAWIDPELLVDSFGVRVDRLPEPLRSFFRGEANGPASMSLPLAPRLWMILDDIFATPYSGALRTTYLRAKISELICEVAGSLTRISEPDQRAAESALTYRELMKVEAAAMIYMKELSAPPSVDEIARRIGLNRNKLTSGFREVFGCSPHEYSRDLRMDWARRLIEDRAMSVCEIAHIVGYSTTSAFSRAFSDQFGFSPSRFNGQPIREAGPQV